MLNRT